MDDAQTHLLRALADRAELTELAYRYAQRVDARDPEGVATCFTPDARFETTDGTMSIQGHTELIPFFRTSFTTDMLRSATSSHLMSNVSVDVDGDAAHLAIETVVFLLDGDGERILARGLRYQDDCVRTDVGWRIAHRRHELVWQGQMPGDAPAR